MLEIVEKTKVAEYTPTGRVSYIFRRVIPPFGKGSTADLFRYVISDSKEGEWAECSLVLRQDPPTEEEWKQMPFSNIPYPNRFKEHYLALNPTDKMEIDVDEEERSSRLPPKAMNVEVPVLKFRFVVHADANLRTGKLSRSNDNAFEIFTCDLEPKTAIEDRQEAQLPWPSKQE